jgi:hypothetical protein
MRRANFQFRLSDLLAFTGLLCLTIGTWQAANQLASQEPPLASIRLGFISIFAGGATVGYPFRRPVECAVIAWIVVPIYLLLRPIVQS